jgi:hypothetical protein
MLPDRSSSSTTSLGRCDAVVSGGSTTSWKIPSGSAADSSGTTIAVSAPPA